jgi:hypothetical protein
VIAEFEPWRSTDRNLASDTDLLSSAALHDVEQVCSDNGLSYLPRMLG